MRAPARLRQSLFQARTHPHQCKPRLRSPLASHIYLPCLPFLPLPLEVACVHVIFHHGASPQIFEVLIFKLVVLLCLELTRQRDGWMVIETVRPPSERGVMPNCDLKVSVWGG